MNPMEGLTEVLCIVYQYNSATASWTLLGCSCPSVGRSGELLATFGFQERPGLRFEGVWGRAGLSFKDTI